MNNICQKWRKIVNHKILKALEFHAKMPYSVINIFKRQSPNFGNREMKAACVAAESNTDCYVTYRLRSKAMTDIPILPHLSCDLDNKIAIVMQGPLMVENDFTLETAKFYKRCYPQALIIVSTWKDSDSETIEKIKQQNVVVVLSDLPDNCGNLNINYQTVNTLAGVKKAKEMGAEFVCKTRTDQRIYHTDAMRYLANLVRTFPVNNEDFVEKQKGRIVTMCMPYGDLFYPYCLADFLYFGYTEDIEELFSLPLDKRQKGGYGNGKTRRKVAEEMIAPEIQFLREYIRRMGGNNECTVKSYWQFTKNHLVTINKDEIGLFWPKYEGRYSENTQNGSYYLNEEENAFRCYNFDFIRWLNLYQGTLKYDQKYEEYAEFIL